MPDLSDFDTVAGSNEGAGVDILNPQTGELFEPSIVIWIYGVDSTLFQKAQQIATNKRLKGLGRKRGNITFTAEDLEEEGLNALAKCVFKWENIEWEGKTLECTFKNIRMVLERLPWMREQLDVFMTDRANFLQSSRGESTPGVPGDSSSSTTPQVTS